MNITHGLVALAIVAMASNGCSPDKNAEDCIKTVPIGGGDEVLRFSRLDMEMRMMMNSKMVYVVDISEPTRDTEGQPRNVLYVEVSQLTNTVETIAIGEYEYSFDPSGRQTSAGKVE